jgi:hypothetical protein
MTTVIAMHDEFDPDLAKAFAQVREPLAYEQFSVSLLHKLERMRRARVRRHILIIAALALMVSLNLRPVLEATAAAVRFVGELTPVSTDWLTTPWGWAASVALGAGLLFHFRPSRR